MIQKKLTQMRMKMKLMSLLNNNNNKLVRNNKEELTFRVFQNNKRARMEMKMMKKKQYLEHIIQWTM